MRIKHFFGLAVLAAMTASCSSNNDLVNGGNGSGENESGVSYASITIDLPTTSSTRATTNDQFDGGTASEYAVNDATLVIFEKGTATSEKDYKFLKLYHSVIWSLGKMLRQPIRVSPQKQLSRLNLLAQKQMRQVVNTMHWSFLTMKQQQATRLHLLQHLQRHTDHGMLQQTQLT